MKWRSAPLLTDGKVEKVSYDTGKYVRVATAGAFAVALLSSGSMNVRVNYNATTRQPTNTSGVARDMAE